MESVQPEAQLSINNVNKDNSLVLNFEESTATKTRGRSLDGEQDVKQSTSPVPGGNESKIRDKIEASSASTRVQQTLGRFFSISISGSLERGYFESFNDVYVKYSIVAGPDWILATGMDVGITQIARYKLDKNDRQQFTWNQPISISYKSYNFFGWPQLVLSVYYFDIFGNDVILGYGCSYLPICKTTQQLSVPIFTPRSPSLAKRFLCFVTGRKPELVNATLITRPDCRCVLQMVKVGQIDLLFNTISKDITSNGYKSQ